MPRIREWYKIIVANDIKELESKVNKLMGEGRGFAPTGGVRFVHSMGVFYYQAMAKVFKKGGPGRPQGSLGKQKDVVSPTVMIPEDGMPGYEEVEDE